MARFSLSLSLSLSLLVVGVIALASLAAPPADAQFIPNDTHWDSFPPAPGNHSGQWNMRDIQMPLAWEITTGSPEIVIAIVDGQAVHTHPDLVEGRWFNLGEDLNRNGVFDDAPASQGGDVDGLDTDNNGYADDFHGWDFADDDNDPSDGPGTLTRHGTQVAGIPLARTHNAEGVAGIAGGDGTAGSGARYMVLSWDDSGASTPQEKDAQMADAVEYATANGAHVINMSFVDPAPDELDGALDAAHAAGVVLIAARGNIGQAPSCGAKGWFPANHTQTLSVGAVVESGSRWTNSCLNPDLMAPGGESVVTTGFQFPSAPYNTFGGTSAAAPHVAGVAALLLSVQPSLTPTDVEAILLATADEAGCAEIAPSHTYAQECGAGLVDAYAALVYTLENYGGHLTQNLTIPAGETWNLGNVTLEFAPTTKLIVEGTLNADGTTFTATDLAQGWNGIRFEPGSDGELDGAIIERVASFGGHAVRINNASPAILSSEIRSPVSISAVTGIWVYGSQSTPHIEDNIITGMTYDGIRVSSGAEVRLIRNTVQGTANDGLAVYGSSTEVFAGPAIGGAVGNQFVNSAGGDGIYATVGADVYLGYYYYPFGGTDAQGYNSMTGNAGRGVLARAGGYVSGGNASFNQRNRIFGNTTEDARAKNSGSTALVRCDWWNHTTPPFRTSAVSGGFLDDSYWLTEDPYVNPSAPCVNTTGTLRSGGGSPGTAQKSLTRSPADRIAEAAATAHEDPAGALADLSLLAEEDPSLAPVALAEIARIGARGDASLATRMTAEALLSTRLAAGRHGEAAQQGLLRLRYTDGDTSGALALAEALTGSLDTGARVFGLVSQAMLLAETGRLSDAAATLAALEAEPDGLREAALVRADLASLGTSLSASPEHAHSAKTATSASDVERAGLGTPGLGAVYPNPTTGTAHAPLVLAGTAHIRVAVYDVLGREVALVAESAMEAGRHEIALAGTQWAPGVYFVSAQVTDESGASRTYVRRFTLSQR